jgi:tetratricopeptide (TPR) repeat protein
MRETGDRAGEAAALDALGYALHHLGRHEDAAARYQRAARCGGSSEIGTRKPKPWPPGRTLDALGNRAAAGDALRQAIEILEELGNADAAQVRARLESRSATPPARRPSMPPPI